MASKILIIVLLFFFSLGLCPSKAQTWVRAGFYWHGDKDYDFPVSNINSSLFTHLIFGFADVNDSTYQLSLPSVSDEIQFSNFTEAVRKKNPSVTTILSIGASITTISSMLSNDSNRKSFIDSSIKKARLYGFHGLDFWFNENTGSPMDHLGIFFKEWRAAAVLDARESRLSQLILTASGKSSADYPVDAVQRYLNWVHVISTDYRKPTTDANFTGAYAALYDPSGDANTDDYIKAWIDALLSSNKLVFCLPYYGYSWPRLLVQ